MNLNVVSNACWLLSARIKDEHALRFIDLDQFKVVNNTCGHTAGDELLRQLRRNTTKYSKTQRHSDPIVEVMNLRC